MKKRIMQCDYNVLMQNVDCHSEMNWDHFMNSFLKN